LFIYYIQKQKVVHFAHFHSLIKYGIIFWGNSTTTHKEFIVKKERMKERRKRGEKKDI